MVTEIIIAVSTLAGTLFGKNYYDAKKNKDNNDNKLDITKLQAKIREQDKLIALNTKLTEEIQKLEEEVNELRNSLNIVKTAFDMFFNMVIDEIKDKPQLIKGLELLQENLKKK